MVLAPPPVVDVTTQNTSPFYAGSALTLRCTAEIDISVDVSYMVEVEWLKSGELLESNDHTTISNVTQLSSHHYEATLHLNPLSKTLHTASYSCKVTASPDTSLVQGAMQTGVKTITVQGYYLQAKLNNVF